MRNWISEYLFVAVGAAFSFLTIAADEPETKYLLLKPVDLSKVELKPKQAMLLERIKKAKETVGDVKVLTIGEELTSKTDGPLRLPIPDLGKDIIITGYSVKVDFGTKVLTWKNKDQSVHLTVTDDAWHGMIYAHGRVYHLQPLGNGVQAISQVDQGKLVDEPKQKK